MVPNRATYHKELNDIRNIHFAEINIYYKQLNKTSQDDKCFYISTSIKTIFREYENENYNTCKFVQKSTTTTISTLHKLKLELLQLIVSIIYQHFMSNANCSRGRFLYNFAHFVILILILSEDGFDRSRNIRAFIILTCFVQLVIIV